MAVARFLLASSLLLLITFAVISDAKKYDCYIVDTVQTPPGCLGTTTDTCQVNGGVEVPPGCNSDNPSNPSKSAAEGMEVYGLLGSLMIGWFAAIF